MVITILFFLCLKTSLCHPHFWRVFNKYRILGWQLFPFSTLKMSFYCLPFSIPSIEKLAVVLAIHPWKVMHLFCLRPFKNFSLSLICSCFTIKVLVMVFFAFLILEVPWDSWISGLMSFNGFWKILRHCLFKYYFCPICSLHFWGSLHVRFFHYVPY